MYSSIIIVTGSSTDTISFLGSNINFSGNSPFFTLFKYSCIFCFPESVKNLLNNSSIVNFSDPSSSLFKFGCPKCAGNAVKTTDEFEQELHTYASNFELLSPYIRANKKVHVRCNDCGNDDWITPNKLKSGQQCKFCHETIGEKNIRKYLETNNINFDSQKSFDGLVGVGNKSLTYDFYLPDENILIEFQGEQHEHPVTFGGRSKSEAVSDYAKQQEHDNRKRDYALSHSINLLEIWYYDIDNIEQILNDKLYKIA